MLQDKLFLYKSILYEKQAKIFYLENANIITLMLYMELNILKLDYSVDLPILY